MNLSLMCEWVERGCSGLQLALGKEDLIPALLLSWHFWKVAYHDKDLISFAFLRECHKELNHSQTLCDGSLSFFLEVPDYLDWNGLFLAQNDNSVELSDAVVLELVASHCSFLLCSLLHCAGLDRQRRDTCIKQCDNHGSHLYL